MSDSLARLIVDEALAIQRQRPDLSALQVLDLTMRGRRGTTPDFGTPGDSGCLIDAGGAFGALLAEAFDAQVTFSTLRSLDDSTGPNAFEEYWFQRVKRAFATRYGLRDAR